MPPIDPVEHHITVRRTARYFTTGPSPEASSEVWFVLHGIGQLASIFLLYFADLADGSRLLVAPEALSRYYKVPPESAPPHERPVGATWMTREARDQDIADYVAYLDDLHARLIDAARSPRVTVLGFSQGAATATRWLLQGRSRIDRVILWGGLTPPDTSLPDLSRALVAPLTIAVGLQDQFVTGDALDAEHRRLTDAGVPHEVVTFQGGHGISRTTLRRIVGL
jgi:predicted esterase